MDILISFSASDVKKMKKFEKRHQQCGKRAARFTICVTPIAAEKGILKYQCRCGAEIDLSSFHNP
ncbi:MAG: hypothetical protein A2745_01340 [Candidatus Harrisonbacteria bacterium RIFCSPHIGHO2_01_FULL_44_13]|uniref:Uncharacterized protein n=1 Tax=Candidatus Harrisonbacteria bacterium RIFCSPLOWO2_01_FULL_44_18 TaxID=1798407 RepID=A0A1G1ZNC0_9BACT|nr:MAG: hypothetical protein A2745_01340 [Candidatus Harrisonbacteria bacterium RIFCSPHIGHO2_01_FULL_44_13]OGY66143.1 MAG: hypothetical protein A3A16_02435 [Candidatus Harrisonbacteria bacterium RIFCSPLOWO2_01_FULL_44_18]